MTALGMLLVTLLDPGFVPRFHFSAYGETRAGGDGAARRLPFCRGAGRARHRRTRPNWIELSLILAAMINAKQSGIGLVLALAGAAVVLGAIERGGRKKTAARRNRAGSASGGAALRRLALLRRARRRRRAGAVAVRPVELGAAARDVRWASPVRSPKSRFILPPCCSRSPASRCCCGGRAGRRPRATSAFNAAAFVLYNGFLVATYIAHFSPRDERRGAFLFPLQHASVADPGALAGAGGARAGAVAGGRVCACARRAAAAALCVALLAPVAFAERLRFDIEMPQPLVWDLGRRTEALSAGWRPARDAAAGRRRRGRRPARATTWRARRRAAAASSFSATRPPTRRRSMRPPRRATTWR